MKLLFDCTELSYLNENSGHKAGVFYVALNLLKEFQKLGIDITFYCDFKRYYFIGVNEGVNEGVNIFKDIPLLKEHSLMNKIIGKTLFLTQKFPLRIKYAILILARFYDCWFYRINNKNLKNLEQFDAYFSPFTPPSKEIKASNLKRFRMIHDIIPILENGMPKSPKDWYYKIYNSIDANDFYFANSENTRQDVLKYFPSIKEENIRTTLLGANEKFYPDSEDAPIKVKYIFSLCTLGKRKNLINAIKNFFAFIEKNKIKDLKLVLGGAVWTKYQKELDKALDMYDKSKLIFTGYIDEKDLRKYYSNAICFIYPSLYEGFGLPVLEAMQCGCPVITSNVSSLPEVIGDCGIKIDPENDNEMIRAYEKMYFDKFFRELCTERGLLRAKHFSWRKCACNILDFIKENVDLN